ncbi:chemotaxis protein CheW [Oceanicoccus sagamiensis]|uniref:Chemotaxis protein CheW n=1 Tax=Oceanicoccus sagamiensis TaxID=716816 RepID=A0A1X9NEE3_9GAMM|nr:chemotaxis protein CheW [Oceanicoccus sagamiensis]
MDIDSIAVAAETEVSLEGIDFIASGNQYLTFTLGQEHYGVDILCVREIRGWDKPTLIPNSPSYVKGVVNLRGLIVPIIDLRVRFQVGEASYNPTTVVIVLALDDEQGSRTMGYVVDAVSDVLNAEDDEIKKAPLFQANVSPDYVEGIVNVGNDVVTILSTEALQRLENENNE